MINKFGTLITAMATPFTKENDLDIDTAIELSEYLLENKTDTLLLSGTTGESPTLTHEEDFLLLQEIVKAMRGRIPIMAGTGSNSTQTAINSSLKAQEIGVDSLLQVVPYYNKPNQEGIYQHFKAISEAVTLPIFLYNIPGRTGVNMLPETVKRLAECSNIVGIKEAAGDMVQLKAMVDETPDDFTVYVGDDALTLDAIQNGANGVVSVASHIVGKDMKKLIDLALTGEITEASKIQEKLSDLFDVLFIDSNPIPVKYALRLLGFPMGAPRLPLIDLSDANKKLVETIVDRCLGVTEAE